MSAPKRADGHWNVVMETALEKDPPIIQWFRKPSGIYEAVVVYDPHADGGHNGTKAACKRQHPFTEENTIVTRDGRQCRTCKNERRNERERAARRARKDLESAA